jgi:hypothetical protein
MADNGMKEHGAMFLVSGELRVPKDTSYEMGTIDSAGDDESRKERRLMRLRNECLLAYTMTRSGGYPLLEGLGAARM